MSAVCFVKIRCGKINILFLLPSSGIELGEGLDAEDVVDDAAGLTAAVHGEYGVAHIDTAERYG